ncbi:hypothetical protein, partial [Shewanella litoralis]|uniref:hypothetical protein n=1 Tax=Shewanella litoralis TaxID=2282700 RepID=UPI001F0F1DE8
GLLITAVKAAVAAAETPAPMAETFPCFVSIEHLTPPFFLPIGGKPRTGAETATVGLRRRAGRAAETVEAEAVKLAIFSICFP